MIHRLFATALTLCTLISLAARAEETVWLSTLNLTNAHVAWKPARPDKSVDGNPLTLRSRVHPRGVGTLARTQLALQLDGGARRFKAVVGIDDEVPAGKGSVEFRVLGDGRRLLWSSGIMRQGLKPKVVDVDVTGVKLLTLVVTEGMDGLDNDHADWADARLEGATKPIVTVDANVPAFPSDPQTPVVISVDPTPAAPRLHAPWITGIRPGTPFLHRISATGRPPLRFSAQNLPAGLSLDPATGILTGTLTQAGDFTLLIQVENADGRDAHTFHIVASRTLALTPPLGWNSYDNFGAKVTEQQFLDNARVFARELQPFGWQYAVVDFLWFDPNPYCKPEEKQPPAMDEYGRLTPALNRFPSATNGVGFKAIAGQVHALGLRFGIHIMRGIPRAAVKANLPVLGTSLRASDIADTNSICGWNEDMFGVRASPGGQAYYDSLLKLYENWGIDFIKVDDIASPYYKAEVEMVRNAIDKLNRSVVLSLSPGTAPVSETAHLVEHAEMWRETGDFWDNWDQLEDQFHKGETWRHAVGPGHWPDADMLPIGHIGDICVGRPRSSNFNRAEQVTLLTLWSLLPSPLMLGADLTQLDSWTRALLTNPEVLAINQDAVGAAGVRLLQKDGREVWSRKLSDDSLALGLFNRGNQDSPVTVRAGDLKLAGAVTLRDVWQRRDLGRFKGRFTATVPAHGAVLLVLKPDPATP